MPVKDPDNVTFEEMQTFWVRMCKNPALAGRAMGNTKRWSSGYFTPCAYRLIMYGELEKVPSKFTTAWGHLCLFEDGDKQMWWYVRLLSQPVIC